MKKGLPHSSWCPFRLTGGNERDCSLWRARKRESDLSFSAVHFSPEFASHLKDRQFLRLHPDGLPVFRIASQRSPSMLHVKCSQAPDLHLIPLLQRIRHTLKGYLNGCVNGFEHNPSQFGQFLHEVAPVIAFSPSSRLCAKIPYLAS